MLNNQLSNKHLVIANHRMLNNQLSNNHLAIANQNHMNNQNYTSKPQLIQHHQAMSNLHQNHMSNQPHHHQLHLAMANHLHMPNQHHHHLHRLAMNNPQLILVIANHRMLNNQLSNNHLAIANPQLIQHHQAMSNLHHHHMPNQHHHHLHRLAMKHQLILVIANPRMLNNQLSHNHLAIANQRMLNHL
jgi:hypothetical protein